MFSHLWIYLRFAGPWVDEGAQWARGIELSLHPQFLRYGPLAAVWGIKTVLQKPCKIFLELRKQVQQW